MPGLSAPILAWSAKASVLPATRAAAPNIVERAMVLREVADICLTPMVIWLIDCSPGRKSILISELRGHPLIVAPRKRLQHHRPRGFRISIAAAGSVLGAAHAGRPGWRCALLRAAAALGDSL